MHFWMPRTSSFFRDFFVCFQSRFDAHSDRLFVAWTSYEEKLVAVLSFSRRSELLRSSVSRLDLSSLTEGRDHSFWPLEDHRSFGEFWDHNLDVELDQSFCSWALDGAHIGVIFLRWPLLASDVLFLQAGHMGVVVAGCIEKKSVNFFSVEKNDHSFFFKRTQTTRCRVCGEDSAMGWHPATKIINISNGCSQPAKSPCLIATVSFFCSRTLITWSTI